MCLCIFKIILIILISCDSLRDGLPKKSSCSFEFCPNYLDPFPLIWTTCTIFFNTNVAKNLGRGLPLPPPPQIDPIYTVCEKWTKNLGRAPPPHLDKIQESSNFFCESVPYLALLKSSTVTESWVLSTTRPGHSLFESLHRISSGLVGCT